MVFPMQQHQYSDLQFLPQMSRPSNRNGLQQMVSGFSGSNSPIAYLAKKGFGDLSKTLSNVDQVIKVVRSATPIVQEYGPMVKNLPAMYRMVKALSNVDSDDMELADTQMPDELKVKSTDNNGENRQVISGQSIPKLYI